MKEPKILIYCKAFNTEKVIRRAINCVLKQTYKNWTLCLIDNGSTDKTSNIIREYGKKDERIKTFRNEKNNVWKKEHGLVFNISNSTDCDYVCTIDSDDELYPQFLEKMLSFLTQNNLDAAFCGIEYIHAPTNKIMSTRIPEKKLIIQGSDFENQFCYYQMYIRTMWGKLYSRKILMEKYKKYKPYSGYGGDTIYVLQYLMLCNNFGILNKPLYKWYEYSKSHSFTFNTARLESSEILHNTYIEFLKTKCGRINKQNSEMINLIYLYNIKDALNLIMKTHFTHIEKLEHIYTLLKNKTTAAVFSDKSVSAEEVKQLIIMETSKIAQIKEFCQHEEICQKIYSELQFLCYLCSTELSKQPLLKNFSETLLQTLKEAVLFTIKSDYKQALESAMSIKDTEINASDKETYLMFCINLAAFTENIDAFFSFKKKWIAYLQDSGHNEKARAEWELIKNVVPDTAAIAQSPILTSETNNGISTATDAQATAQ